MTTTSFMGISVMFHEQQGRFLVNGINQKLIRVSTLF